MEPPAYEEHDEVKALRLLAETYQFRTGAIAQLRQHLSKRKIIVIVDDSPSMSNPLAFKGDFEPARTRWDELKERVLLLLDIAIVFHCGLDLYFLNHTDVFDVKDKQQCALLFDNMELTKGGTPLTPTYNRVLDDIKGEESTLIIVATDGIPNRLERGHWVPDLYGFYQALLGRTNPQKCPTTIMACTEEQEAIDWLNKLDRVGIPYFDVCDDYQNEKCEILKIQRSLFEFTLGDYIVKSLLGPIVPLYGKLDSYRLTRSELALYLGVDVTTLPSDKCNDFDVICFGVCAVVLGVLAPILLYSVSH